MRASVAIVLHCDALQCTAQVSFPRGFYRLRTSDRCSESHVLSLSSLRDIEVHM